MSATVISDAKARSSIEQALQSVADSAEEQLAGLEKCLELIDAHLRAGGPGWAPQNDEEWWWALRRLETLQHYDRVATALKLSQGSFNAQLYTELRSANIIHVAQSATSCGNFAALTVLLDSHPYSLAPYILEILSCAPETFAAKSIESLLRQILSLQGAPPTLPRTSDWVEINSVYTLLRRQQDQQGNNNNNGKSNSFNPPPAALVTATENLVQAGTPRYSPPTETQIASWARRRAVSVDRLTGQLPAAMELLETTRAVLHYGPESQPVADLHRAAQQLLMIVKLAAARSNSNGSNDGNSSSDEEERNDDQEGGSNALFPSTATVWRMDLGSFAARDNVGRLQILFHLTESDDLAEDIPRIIIPFLNQLSTETKPIRKIVRHALEAEAATRLSWVVAFIQLEAQRPAVFETAGDLASAACAAAYACHSFEAWSLQEKLLHAAVEATESDTASEQDEKQALLATIAQVHGHLTAARVLTKHGLSTSLCGVRDATMDDILIMVRTLLARVARAQPAESRWVDLWADLRTAQSSGLQALPIEDIRAEMCRALLRCGQLRPAQKHLAALENTVLKEELVLDAARDAVYSEENPDDATVRRALDVLKTLPDSKAALEEASFIHAAAKLRALGIEMPPLQLRQQPDKATLIQKAIATAPLKALKDIEGLLELSKSLKTGLKKAAVLSLIAEAALALGQPRLAEDVAMQLAYEGSREGWQIAARVAMEEPCSSESERRRLLAYAMRFASAEELEGQLHCWQASDSGAAGDSEIWSIPEHTGSLSTSKDTASGRDIVTTPYMQPLKEALDTILLIGSGSAEDGLLACSCLHTLGVEGQKQWAASVQMQRVGLDPAALRQAYIVGIASASMLALVSTQHQQQALEERLETPADTTAQGAAEKHPTDATYTYRELLFLSPQELLSAALHVLSATTTAEEAASKKSVNVIDLEYLESFILDMCQHLVSCADAQRVAQLLPGHYSAENWMEGGAEAQRSVVLQLAASAGRGEKTTIVHSVDGGDEEEEEEILGAADNEDVSITATGRQASLEEALTLAERCGVDFREVQLAYAIAVLTRMVHHRQLKKNSPSGQASASLQAAAERDVANVWSSLLETKPIETVSAILSQVYPQLSTAGSSKVEVEWLVWVLHLCGECFQHCASVTTPTAATIDTPSISQEEYTAASGVLDGLAEAITALHAACTHADVNIFLNPTMHLLKERYSEASSITPIDTLSAAVIQQLLEHCEYTIAAALAFAVDAVAKQHAVALDISSRSSTSFYYPVTASTVYVVTLCKELSALAMAEGVQAQQRTKLEELFRGASTADCIATAAFTCLNGPPPIKFPSEPLPVFLSPRQSLAVLESALAALRSASETSSTPSTATFLQKERVRLTVLLQIEATCQDDLLEHQVQYLQTLIPELREEIGEEDTAAAAAYDAMTAGSQKLKLLINFLSTLFSDGCSFGAITNIAEACKEIGSWVVKAVEDEEIVFQAAENAVNNALGALQGGSPSTTSAISTEDVQPLSVGDAVQNLYGVIRALDILPDSMDHLLETTRSRVWSLLQTHAAEHQSGSTDAAAVEAHLQVIQMLGSLGYTMWQGWQPPEGAVTISSTTGAAYKHAETLLHSRAAAALAASWPSALKQAAITPEDFSSLESTESALMKLVDSAATVEQLSAVVVVLSEVLDGAFIGCSSEGDDNDNDNGTLALDPLHEVWTRTLTALLTQGSLDTVIAALDVAAAAAITTSSGATEVSKKQRVLVREGGAEALVAAADSALGTVAAAAVALLLPYRRIQHNEWAKIVSLQSGDDLQGLPGLTPLAVAALHRQGLIADLARQNPGVFKQVCRALLEKDDAAFFAVPRGSTNTGSHIQQLPPRTGLAVALAAQLVLGTSGTGSRSGNISAAAWVAMQHAGTHSFLRILDSGSTVLSRLLHAGAKSNRGKQGIDLSSTEEEIELEPAVRAVLGGAGTCAEEVLKRMPVEAAAALEHLGR
ncbi:putative MAG2-interacting protein 2 [Nannochloris sp. 'desiccata']|nr:putative MAG2-interacting protein 2 [Chlorella desiccata (nom. nud.)]